MADRLAGVPVAHSVIVTVTPSEIEHGYSIATGGFTIEASEVVEEGPGCWGAELRGGAGCTPRFVPGKLHFKNKFCDNCRNSLMVPSTQLRALSEDQAACVVNKRSEGFWNSAPVDMGGGQYRILNNTAGCTGPWLALFREQPPMIQWRAQSRFKPRSLPAFHLSSPTLSRTPALTRALIVTRPNHSICPEPEPEPEPKPLAATYNPRPHLQPTLARSAIPEHWATDKGYIRLCVAKGTLVPARTLRCGQPQASPCASWDTNPLTATLPPPQLLPPT